MFADFEFVEDLAAAITLLLPSFLAASLFEITNPAIARDRQELQWVMWSLALSLVLYGSVYGIYSAVDLPRKPLDPEFYTGLLATSVAAGYLAGRGAGSERGRQLTRWLRILLPPWVWVEVLSAPNWIVVHLTDGTVLYGYPRRYTDSPKEDVREIYLEEPEILTERDGQRVFEALPESAGVLIDSSRILFIQVLERQQL